MTADSQDEPGAIRDGQPCRCGHPRAAHSHYRRGSDCALCPAGSCKRFRSAEGGRRGLFRKRG